MDASEELNRLKQVVADSAGRINDLVSIVTADLFPEQFLKLTRNLTSLNNEIAVLKALAPEA